MRRSLQQTSKNPIPGLLQPHTAPCLSLCPQPHPTTHHSSQVFDHDNWDVHRSTTRHARHIAGLCRCARLLYAAKRQKQPHGLLVTVGCARRRAPRSRLAARWSFSTLTRRYIVPPAATDTCRSQTVANLVRPLSYVMGVAVTVVAVEALRAVSGCRCWACIGAHRDQAAVERPELAVPQPKRPPL
jgi:hypothetical protein